MTARRLLAVLYAWLVDAHGQDAVDDLLYPPTYEEKRAARLAELRALGIAINA